jgi:hypothetical protein
VERSIVVIPEVSVEQKGFVWKRMSWWNEMFGKTKYYCWNRIPCPSKKTFLDQHILMEQNVLVE